MEQPSYERTADQRANDMRFENVMAQVDLGKITLEIGMAALREIVIIGEQLKLEGA